MESRIISIVNQKGGVGKTTTAINLASILALMGKKVLLIDLDPQGNASTGLGIEQTERNATSYQILKKTRLINDVITPSQIKNLNIIPANIHLSSIDIEIANFPQKEYILKQAIMSLGNEYEFIFIDCPPSLSLLTINALTSSEEVIIPMLCDFFSLEGLSNLLKTITKVEKHLNNQIHLSGILFTMYDKRSKLTEQVEKDVRSYLGDLVYSTTIPKNVKLAESPSYGKPIVIYDKKCTGSIAYTNLANEILTKKEHLAYE